MPIRSVWKIPLFPFGLSPLSPLSLLSPLPYRMPPGAEFWRKDGLTKVDDQDAPVIRFTLFVYGYSTNSGSESALSGSFSVLFTPVDSDAFKLNIGGVYRLKGNTDMGNAAMKADTDAGVGRLFFDRPSSFDLGIGIGKLTRVSKTRGYEFNLGLQYGRTDWGGAAGAGGSLEYDRLSAGLEFVLLRPRQRFNRFAFRAGYFISDPSGDTSNNQDWPDIDGITWGVGVRMGKLSIDIAQELVTHDGTADEDILLTSVGASLLF